MALEGMPATFAATLAAAPPRGEAEATIRRHLLAVWRYVRMLGASAELADDLTQEAFVVAVRREALAADPAAALTFLRRTARFLFLRHLRDGADAVLLADAADEVWARDCATDGGDGLREALRACVGELQGRARLAVERSYGIGSDSPQRRDDIARELGMQPNGVKTLLQRVRQQLRACIERRKQS
jgi:RNA polymerase sigma factor (sigma-70 family)